MHHPFAVLVIAERFYRQREQGWFFFYEHGGHLPFRGAVNARIRPVRFPTIQIGLPFLQALEAFSLERRVFGVSDAALDFSLSIWIQDPAGEGDRTIMSEHVAIEGIECGVVDVGNEYAFTEIIQHQDARSTA